MWNAPATILPLYYCLLCFGFASVLLKTSPLWWRWQKSLSTETREQPRWGDPPYPGLHDSHPNWREIPPRQHSASPMKPWSRFAFYSVCTALAFRVANTEVNVLMVPSRGTWVQHTALCQQACSVEKVWFISAFTQTSFTDTGICVTLRWGFTKCCLVISMNAREKNNCSILVLSCRELIGLHRSQINNHDITSYIFSTSEIITYWSIRIISFTYVS